MATTLKATAAVHAAYPELLLGNAEPSQALVYNDVHTNMNRPAGGIVGTLPAFGSDMVDK